MCRSPFGESMAESMEKAMGHELGRDGWPSDDYVIRQRNNDLERLRVALRLIATPKRPDGTWNRDREACRKLAQDALDGK